MILLRANLFRGQLEGVGLENQDFLSPETLFGPKKVEIFSVHPFQWPG
jgi:hypothetical protein